MPLSITSINWKSILIGVGIVLLASYVVFLKIEGLSHKAQLNALEAAKIAALDNRALELDATIANYQDTLKLKDAKIDSFDIALSLKDIQLDNLHNDVQVLAGDSLGILNALNRVFSK